MYSWVERGTIQKCKCKVPSPRIHVDQNVPNHKKLAISKLPLASSSKRVLVHILSYENEISFTCKLNSFSCRFEEEAKGDSEMAYSELLMMNNSVPLILVSCYIHTTHAIPNLCPFAISDICGWDWSSISHTRTHGMWPLCSKDEDKYRSLNFPS